MESVVVFLDYQNVYHGARRAFFDGKGPSSWGNVWPLALGRLIASRGPVGCERVLQQVRVYRGLPDAARDLKGYAAAARQSKAQYHEERTDDAAAWRSTEEGRYYCHRTLRYPPRWPREKAQEKGVDVQLAVDFVAGALAGRFDVGVIMSTDTDLRPALEAVLDVNVDLSWPFRFPPDVDANDVNSIRDYFKAAALVNSVARPRCEVAAWQYPGGHAPRLSLERPVSSWNPDTGEVVRERARTIWCHWLDRADFDTVADLTNYTLG